jgi:hypothetical protein
MVSNVGGPVVQWYECRPRTAEVAGPNPARSTIEQSAPLHMQVLCRQLQGLSLCVLLFDELLLDSELVFFVFRYAWISLAD